MVVKIENVNFPSKREEILKSAIACVTKDRNSSYGEPEDNFQHIADLWNAQFKLRRGEFAFSPFDVAIMMALMKVARTRTSPDNMDNLIDGAGYLACAGGCTYTSPGDITFKELER